MKYKKYIFSLAFFGGIFSGMTSMTSQADEHNKGLNISMTQESQTKSMDTGSGSEERGAVSLRSGWNMVDDRWYWLTSEGNLYEGWLQADGRTYYFDEEGVMACGWKEIGGEWYYFHRDGGLNKGELVLENAVYEFNENNALISAQWAENTGGGAYHAGCYDEITQKLFDDLNTEKKELYFDEYSDEDDYDKGTHGRYDRYAGFRMDMNLNKAAAHRLEEAMMNGYAGDRISGEGTVNDYLASIPYRENATCLELYIRGCKDEDEVFSRVLEKTEDKKNSKEDRKYSLEYYRSLGMTHKEKDGDHYYMIILMR
jgi:hypothetical protein